MALLPQVLNNGDYYTITLLEGHLTAQNWPAVKVFASQTTSIAVDIIGFRPIPDGLYTLVARDDILTFVAAVPNHTIVFKIVPVPRTNRANYNRNSDPCGDCRKKRRGVRIIFLTE